jgi:hypothetical protein
MPAGQVAAKYRHAHRSPCDRSGHPVIKGEISMKFDISTVISVVAILVMFYCLWLVISLRKNVPGGVVGNTWKTLTSLVILFTLGYLVTPFFGMLPPILMNVIVSLIFLFGAIYVVITVKLIYRIIEELAG